MSLTGDGGPRAGRSDPTSSASSPARSTVSSPGCARRCRRSGSSWPTRRTSCGRRCRSSARLPRWRSAAMHETKASTAKRWPSSAISRGVSAAWSRTCWCWRAPTPAAIRFGSVDLYLDELVADCRRAVEVLATERGVTIESGASPEIPFRGDEDLLRQLVVNVLQNAVQHTPAGGAVAITLCREAGAVRIRVRDTGAGIPAADRGADFRSLRPARSGPSRPRRRARAADCAMDRRGSRRNARAGIERSRRQHVLRDAAGTCVASGPA